MINEPSLDFVTVLTGVNFVDTVAHLLQKLRRIQYAFMFLKKIEISDLHLSHKMKSILYSKAL